MIQLIEELTEFWFHMILGDAIGRVDTGEEMLVQSFKLGLNGADLFITGVGDVVNYWDLFDGLTPKQN